MICYFFLCALWCRWAEPNSLLIMVCNLYLACCIKYGAQPQFHSKNAVSKLPYFLITLRKSVCEGEGIGFPVYASNFWEYCFGSNKLYLLWAVIGYKRHNTPPRKFFSPLNPNLSCELKNFSAGAHVERSILIPSYFPGLI